MRYLSIFCLKFYLGSSYDLNKGNVKKSNEILYIIPVKLFSVYWLGPNNTFFGSWLSSGVSLPRAVAVRRRNNPKKKKKGRRWGARRRARAEERREPEQSTTTTSSAPHAHTTQHRHRHDLDLPASHPCHSIRSLVPTPLGKREPCPMRAVLT